MNFLKNKLLIIFSSLLCFSCGENHEIEETRKYDDYAEFSFSDVTTMYELEGDHYYIEFYSVTCPHCENLKTSLFNYLDKYKEEEVETKVYIFDAHHSESDVGKSVRNNFKVKPENFVRENLIVEMKENSVSSISDTYWFSIPSLYEIKNGEFVSLTLGSSDIAKKYSELK